MESSSLPPYLQERAQTLFRDIKELQTRPKGPRVVLCEGVFPGVGVTEVLRLVEQRLRERGTPVHYLDWRREQAQVPSSAAWQNQLAWWDPSIVLLDHPPHEMPSGDDDYQRVLVTKGWLYTSKRQVIVIGTLRFWRFRSLARLWLPEDAGQVSSYPVSTVPKEEWPDALRGIVDQYGLEFPGLPWQVLKFWSEFASAPTEEARWRAALHHYFLLWERWEGWAYPRLQNLWERLRILCAEPLRKPNPRQWSPWWFGDVVSLSAEAVEFHTHLKPLVDEACRLRLFMESDTADPKEGGFP